MRRKASKLLESWISNGSDRRPLVIRGARQVGKSTLVRHAVKACGRPLLEVNLERHPELDAVFASLNVERILEALQSLPRTGPLPDGGVLFLDEIQATPNALPALRYLYEERPDLPVVAAGSLLEFALSSHDFSMPVGRISYLHLGPMSFAEFLDATGEDALLTSLLKFSAIDWPSPIVHERLSRLFADYSVVGGMPAVVAEYAKNRSLTACRGLQLDLLDTYRDDFAKYGLRQDLPKLARVLDSAVLHLGHKVKFNQLLPDEQARTTRRILDLLIHARLFTKVRHSDATGLPLAAETDDKTFKLAFIDIGLFNALRGTPTFLHEETGGLLGAHDGAVAEQMVAQELLANEPLNYRSELFYWLRERRQGNAEIDLVVGLGGKVVPIEVKSGAKGRMRSLAAFIDARAPALAVRFDENPPSISRFSRAELLSLPLYAAGQLERLVASQNPNRRDIVSSRRDL